MSFSVKTGHWDARTTVGTQSLTIAGAGDVQAAIFMVTTADDAFPDVDTSSPSLCMGFLSRAATPLEACCGYSVSTTTLGPYNKSWTSTDHTLHMKDANSLATILTMDFSAWTTDGVTVNITATDGNPYVILGMFFGDTTMSSDIIVAGLTKPYTVNCGFEPDLVFAMSAWAYPSSSGVPPDVNNAQFSFGFCENHGGTPIQRSVNTGSWDNGGSIANQRTYGMFSMSGIAASLTDVGMAGRNTLTAFDATGFDYQVAGSVFPVIYMPISVAGTLPIFVQDYSIPASLNRVRVYHTMPFEPFGSVGINLGCPNADVFYGDGQGSVFNINLSDTGPVGGITKDYGAPSYSKTMAYLNEDNIIPRGDAEVVVRGDTLRYEDHDEATAAHSSHGSYNTATTLLDEYFYSSIDEVTLRSTVFFGEETASSSLELDLGDIITGGDDQYPQVPYALVTNLRLDISTIVSPADQFPQAPATFEGELNVDISTIISPSDQVPQLPASLETEVHLDIGATLDPSSQFPVDNATLETILRLDISTILSPANQFPQAPASLETEVQLDVGAIITPVNQLPQLPSSLQTDLPLDIAGMINPTGQVPQLPVSLTSDKTVYCAYFDPADQYPQLPSSFQTDLPLDVGSIVSPADQVPQLPAFFVSMQELDIGNIIDPASQFPQAPADLVSEKNVHCGMVAPSDQVPQLPSSLQTDLPLEVPYLAPSLQAPQEPYSLVSASPVTDVDVSGLDKKLQVLIAKAFENG